MCFVFLLKPLKYNYIVYIVYVKYPLYSQTGSQFSLSNQSTKLELHLPETVRLHFLFQINMSTNISMITISLFQRDKLEHSLTCQKIKKGSRWIVSLYSVDSTIYLNSENSQHKPNYPFLLSQQNISKFQSPTNEPW